MRINLSDVHVIVAKYKENISWINEIPFKTFIYDKSGETPSEYIPLPNIGREAETYIRHIIEHYEHLPMYCVFLQGDPFSHTLNSYNNASRLSSFLSTEIQKTPKNVVGLGNFTIENPGAFNLPVPNLFCKAEAVAAGFVMFGLVTASYDL